MGIVNSFKQRVTLTTASGQWVSKASQPTLLEEFPVLWYAAAHAEERWKASEQEFVLVRGETSLEGLWLVTLFRFLQLEAPRFRITLATDRDSIFEAVEAYRAIVF